ncbi:MAG: hypothetical protein PF513_02200 [Tenericutes bacterium]|jgi:hypothetical protein|nr:hypothetical protein [Mycoplasmatota bacterium]
MKTIGTGWSVFKKNLKLIFSKPYLLLPMMVAWGVFIYTTYWFNTNYNLAEMDISMLLLVLFGFIFLSTFTIGVASLFVLEMLEQHETTGKINPFKALLDMITRDLWRALPIIILWSLVDFILTIIISILDSGRKRKNRPRRSKGPIQRAVEAFRDLVRMGSMTIFTVIAWENLGSKASFDKGYSVFKNRFSEMLVGFGLNKIFGLILVIPIIIVSFALRAGVLPFQTTSIALIIYISVVWSLRKLIEQLFVSELYLWYKHYELTIKKADRLGTKPPSSLYDVPRPSFSDKNYDLLKEHDLL